MTESFRPASPPPSNPSRFPSPIASRPSRSTWSTSRVKRASRLGVSAPRMLRLGSTT